ncbi:hypothetical protein BC628DRAFT_1320016 [Trametes gibbosa]|nr:hypothetical protein BC628DRAFT_1320016 [Trametes gibbosa]
MHTSAPLPVPPTVSFLPLSFAQSRRDIRERKEGFEMERNSTPFAIRAHSLIPLDVAFARDDIRRRYIGSESPTTLTSSPSPLNHDDTAAAGWKDSISNSPMRTPLKPMFFVPATSPNSGSPAPSTPSVYSPSRSWIDMSKEDSSGGNADISWSYDSLVAVYSKENGYSDDEGSGEKMLASLSSDSFDEASFIRMAEDCLGW